MIKILLLGPQGSGKSTQGRLLADYLKIPFISTGDIFRKIASEESVEGNRIKKILDSGQLVDDETTAKLVRGRVGLEDCKGGFILDGYPRTLEQAKRVEDLNFDKAIYVNVPKNIILDRLLKRGREDDTEELIKKRLELYFENTQSLLEYFKNKGLLVEIDGIGDIEQIQNDIRKKLSK